MLCTRGMLISYLGMLSIKGISLNFISTKMTYDVSFTTPNNMLDVKSLLDLIFYHQSNMSVVISGMILIKILDRVWVCVWGGGTSRRNEKIYALKHMLSLLSRQVCRGNFPKQSECFGSTLPVKFWQSIRLFKTHLLIIDKIELY